MSYAGLGQATTVYATLPAHSALIVAIQGALMRSGLLTLRTADGVIGPSSPTLAAIQSWATQNGLSSTGIARTSGGGLVIPQALLNAIVSAPAASVTPAGASKDGVSPVPSAALPDVSLTNGGVPSWAPWTIGAALVAILAGGAVVAMRR